MRFGGRYRLAVHNLAGGRRIVERLGPDDGEVAFNGTFSGPSAEARVRAFDSLRLSGEIVWLTWESFSRRVVVKSFVAEYHSPWWIPYTISCIVVHQAGAITAQPSTMSSLISSDLGNALSAIAGSAISLTSLQTALSATNAFTTGTSDQLQAATATGATLAAIGTQITLQSTLIAAPIEPTTEPDGISAALAATVISAGLLATTVNARSYVGRIGTNLNGRGD